MSITHIEMDQVASHLPELIEEVSGGAEVVITQDDRPVAKIVGYAQPLKKRRLDAAAGLITIAEDFDAPLDDFKEYMR
ncbi:MAG: type II toxin-antitoxin system Phd/YefM family antitoxin [Dehalococcoidia bacterium]